MNNFRSLWAGLSANEVVATNEGWQFRRALLGAISAPSKTTFKDVREFVGGALSRKAYNQATARRNDTAADQNLHDLIGDRRLREDRLTVKCPLALSWIVDRIIFHTQPSPCKVKTNHAHAAGNHTRSEKDNSLVCVYPDKCPTESVRYLMGTKLQLFHTVMRDLQQAHALGKVEVDHVSRSSFDKLVPFYDVEQSIRSCLCVHCYKAKLITMAVCDLWPILHGGATPDSACDCECGLCKDGGCTKYIPYSSSKTVHSMADFSDMLLCPKERLYVSADGTWVEAHRSACVSGNCLLCKRRQDIFFECPKNKGDAQRQVHSARPCGEVRWKNFTTVDERGQAISATAQRRANNQGGGDEDDDFDPLGGARPRARKAIAELAGTVDDFMADLKNNFTRFSKHRRQYKTQRSAFKEKKLTLEEGEVLCIVDFQERLQVQEQDEVQSQHWDREATTIFPCPIFFKCGGEVWAYSFQVLSDDMAQDNAWVQSVMSKLLNEDIPALLRKVGAAPMTRVTIWTDNCAKQFKCRFHFGWIADAFIFCRDRHGNVTGVRVRVEHHYFGACHGKNLSDAEGGMTKVFVRLMVLNMTWKIASSRDLYLKLSKALNFMLRDASSEETVASWSKRKGRTAGSDQRLMTKEFIGEGNTATQKTTFLLTKSASTMMGREYKFFGVCDVTPTFRKAARSSSK
ncbi:unnamed protein product [Ectocarpus sp. 4 AP-2014]